MNTGLYRRVFTDGEAIELFGAHANGLDNIEKCQTFYFRENYGYDGINIRVWGVWKRIFGFVATGNISFDLQKVLWEDTNDYCW